MSDDARLQRLTEIARKLWQHDEEHDSRVDTGDHECRTGPVESTLLPRKPSGEDGLETPARTQNCATSGDLRSDASGPHVGDFSAGNRGFCTDARAGKVTPVRYESKPVRSSGQESEEHVSAPSGKQDDCAPRRRPPGAEPGGAGHRAGRRLTVAMGHDYRERSLCQLATQPDCEKSAGDGRVGRPALIQRRAARTYAVSSRGHGQRGEP